MTRMLLVIGALSIGAWWRFHPRHERSALADRAQSERVLADLAAYRDGLDWTTTNGPHDVETDHGVEFRTTQKGTATIEVASGRATIATGTWRIIVNIGLVTEIVCERRFIHHPPPGFVMLDMSFRKGPDVDGFADELFSVSFDEARDADFRSLCERHALRKVGDGW
jgi:hypothetical protein